MSTQPRAVYQQMLGRAATAQRAMQPNIVTLNAPVGGWNARDAWSDMPADDAIRLDNWYPGSGKVTGRAGSTVFARVGESAPAVFVHLRFVASIPSNLPTMIEEAERALDLAGLRLVVKTSRPLDAPQFLTVDDTASEEDALYALGLEDVEEGESVGYFVETLVSGARGKALIDGERFIVTESATIYTMAHEIGHNLGLTHVVDTDNLMVANTASITNPPPDLDGGQISTMQASDLVDALLVPGTSPVETLAEWHVGDGRKLLAASGGAIWDVTAGGDISTPLQDGFSNDRWQTAQMNGLLLLVNGADTPQQFDGTTLENMSIQETGAGPLSVDTLTGVHVFKSRAYYWTGRDQDFYYTEVNAHAGTLTLFPLGDVAKGGGNLVSMITWTRDGGAGMDDLAVFLMSSGDAIVYAGSNPGDAAEWSLVGVFAIGAALGPRAWSKAGGDVLLATQDGYGLLSRMLPGARGAPGINVSDKIAPAVQEVVRDNRGTFGWQVLHYPNGNRVMVNVPDGGVFHQHVVNLHTGAWCRFIGMNARCWELFEDRPFFGGDSGSIWQADTGTSDGDLNILLDGWQAFNYLKSRGLNKKVDMVRPFLEAAGRVPLEFSLHADFSPIPGQTVKVVLGAASLPGAIWDEAVWDEADWGAVSRAIQGWLGHSARGLAISPHLRVEQKDSMVSWNGTSISYQIGGVI